MAVPGSDSDTGIAIIGMACRLPGGADRPERLWQLLDGGRSAIVPVPPGRWPRIAWNDVADAAAAIGPDTFRGGFLADLEDWDAGFFGVSPAEARRMDPQHRLIMEVTWRALEDAGVGLNGLGAVSAGLFIGLSDSQEFSRLQHQCDPACVDDPYMAPGASTSVVAGRLAGFLDARGPALAVDTACSTSLVALHLAIQSLQRGECEMAIVPAVGAVVHPESLVSAYQIGMLARDGCCKAFDRRADGFVIGEGAGAVVLERAADAVATGHLIRAIVRGAAVNQNGGRSALAAPSTAAQADVIRQALRRGQVAPDEVSYIEAHGAGTALGDAIELEALGQVFGPRAGELPLHVGTVKPNLGHLLTGAGMAGLIKTVLILEHRRIPPSINLSDANPILRRTPWIQPSVRGIALDPDSRPVAGVSSFGWSGTNAHVVLQAAPPAPEPRARSGPHVLALSATSDRALAVLAGELADHLENAAPDIADVAHTLQVARSGHRARKALVCETIADAVSACRALARSAPHAAGGPDLTVAQRDAIQRWEEGGDAAWPDTGPGDGPGGSPGGGPGGGRIISLPPHPFERVRLWPVSADACGASLHCYTPNWRQTVTPASQSPASQSPASLTGTVVLHAEDGHGETVSQDTLARLGLPVVLARPGVSLASDTNGVSGPLVHVVDCTQAGTEDVAAAARDAFAQVMRAYQVISRHHRSREAALLVVVSGTADVIGQDAVHVGQAAAVGAARALTTESPELRCRVVDVDPAARAGSRAQQVATEIRALCVADTSRSLRDWPEDGSLVAWRNGRRRVREWTLADFTSAGSAWKADGVYVITGGTRGLGLALALRLARAGVRGLVLVGRSPASVASLSEISRHGADALSITADLSDPAEMRRVLRVATARFGVVHGVMHCAGVPGGGLLDRKTPAEAAAVIDTKTGTLAALAEAISDRSLELVLLYSSAVTVFGGLGETDYAAANACLGAFADAHSGHGARVLAVSWGPWQHDAWQAAALAHAPEFAERASRYRAEFGITDQAGTALLDRLLTAMPANVLVLTEPVEAMRARWADLRDIEMVAPVARDDAQPRPALLFPYLPPETPMETRIAGIWQQYLGLVQVGIDDLFFELGGNSLVGVSIARRLERDLGMQMPASILFEYPTVRQLAAALTDGVPAAERAQVPGSAGRRRRLRSDAALAARQRQSETPEEAKT